MKFLGTKTQRTSVVSVADPLRQLTVSNMMSQTTCFMFFFRKSQHHSKLSPSKLSPNSHLLVPFLIQVLWWLWRVPSWLICLGIPGMAWPPSGIDYNLKNYDKCSSRVVWETMGECSKNSVRNGWMFFAIKNLLRVFPSLRCPLLHWQKYGESYDLVLKTDFLHAI